MIFSSYNVVWSLGLECASLLNYSFTTRAQIWLWFFSVYSRLFPRTGSVLKKLRQRYSPYPPLTGITIQNFSNVFIFSVAMSRHRTAGVWSMRAITKYEKYRRDSSEIVFHSNGKTLIRNRLTFELTKIDWRALPSVTRPTH